MLDWFSQNSGTLLVGALLLLLIGVLIYFMQKDRKAGKSSCGSSCANCPMSGKCHEKK